MPVVKAQVGHHQRLPGPVVYMLVMPVIHWSGCAMHFGARFVRVVQCQVMHVVQCQVMPVAYYQIRLVSMPSLGLYGCVHVEQLLYALRGIAKQLPPLPVLSACIAQEPV